MNEHQLLNNIMSCLDESMDEWTRIDLWIWLLVHYKDHMDFITACSSLPLGGFMVYLDGRILNLKS